MRQNVVGMLKAAGMDAMPVENPCIPGTPDVNYVEGWIELKQTRRWPVRAETQVRLDHPLMLEQRIWLKRRRRQGGHAYVLLQISQDWLLFDGWVAAKFLGVTTQAQLREHALHVWRGLPQVREELPKCLSSTYDRP